MTLPTPVLTVILGGLSLAGGGCASRSATGAALHGVDSGQKDENPGVDRLYPYIIHESYLGYSDADLLRPLGHQLHVALVFELTGRVRNAKLEDLTRLGLTVQQAHAQALRNLELLANERRIQMTVFQGPAGRPFILVGGSWAAATALLLPRLSALAAGAIGTDRLCASIPHREAMLVFAEADRSYRDAMRSIIKERESDGAKPLTFKLFSISEDGVKPFDEHSR